MSAHAQLVFVVGLTALCAISVVCFVVWLVCSLARDLYRHVKQRHLQIKKSDLDVSYRTGQFYVPPTMRDSK